MISELKRQTRKIRIDSKLRSFNPSWEIVRYDPTIKINSLKHNAVEEFPAKNGLAVKGESMYKQVPAVQEKWISKQCIMRVEIIPIE